ERGVDPAHVLRGERERARPGVLRHVRRARSLGDREQPGRAHEEGQRHLARGGAVRGRDLGEHASAPAARAREATRAERAVARHGDAARDAPRDHRVLDRALLEVIEDLVARDAFWGSTLETRKTWSRRPAIASPTSSSTRPEPYISAVSMCVMPASSPARSAASAAVPPSRSMFHVPWPTTGTATPVGPNGSRLTEVDPAPPAAPAPLVRRCVRPLPRRRAFPRRSRSRCARPLRARWGTSGSPAPPPATCPRR